MESRACVPCQSNNLSLLKGTVPTRDLKGGLRLLVVAAKSVMSLIDRASKLNVGFSTYVNLLVWSIVVQPCIAVECYIHVPCEFD